MVCDYTQDFFIYVPSTNEVEIFSFAKEAEEERRDSMQVLEGSIAGCWKHAPTEWVRIPLEGQVVVYARWNNHRWRDETT